MPHVMYDRYQLETRKRNLQGKEYFLGVVIDLKSKTVIHTTTSMSEQGLVQMLMYKAHRLNQQEAQKSEPYAKGSKV